MRETVGERWGVSRKWGVAMKLIETLRSRTGALKVAELAELFGVTPQHIYRKAANGSIASFRILGVRTRLRPGMFVPPLA